VQCINDHLFKKIIGIDSEWSCLGESIFSDSQFSSFEKLDVYSFRRHKILCFLGPDGKVVRCFWKGSGNEISEKSFNSLQDIKDIFIGTGSIAAMLERSFTLSMSFSKAELESFFNHKRACGVASADGERVSGSGAAGSFQVVAQSGDAAGGAGSGIGAGAGVGAGVAVVAEAGSGAVAATGAGAGAGAGVASGAESAVAPAETGITGNLSAGGAGVGGLPLAGAGAGVVSGGAGSGAGSVAMDDVAGGRAGVGGADEIITLVRELGLPENTEELDRWMTEHPYHNPGATGYATDPDLGVFLKQGTKLQFFHEGSRGGRPMLLVPNISASTWKWQKDVLDFLKEIKNGDRTVML
jgi:hypothetical protein